MEAAVVYFIVYVKEKSRIFSYYILYTVYYILYTVYYILYTVYYILYTVYYIYSTEDSNPNEHIVL